MDNKIKLIELDLKELSKIISNYFLVGTERIHKLILQTNSIDDTLHLLMIHKNCDRTIDSLLYDYLKGKDEKI